MDLSQRLENVAVLGAAGKMGSGISLLLAKELARTRLTPEGQGRTYRLALIDVSETALDGLSSGEGDLEPQDVLSLVQLGEGDGHGLEGCPGSVGARLLPVQDGKGVSSAE